MTYAIQTIDSAPPAAKDVLAGAKQAFGFVPNLLGVMANSPALVKTYVAVSKIFDETALTATERQVVLLTVSAENGCEYCMAAHSAIAGMQHVDQGVISALRDGKPIADAKLESLRFLAAETVRTRGWPSSDAVSRFTGAGYSPAQALEVVLGVGLKTLSNYANHLAATPLDAAFAPVKWSKPTCGSACGCATR